MAVYNKGETDVHLQVRPAGALQGQSAVPGDKSITHRALILGALAAGTTTVTDFLDGADCRSTRQCLEAMDVAITMPSPRSLRIQGRGWGGLAEPREVLDAGNSGTTMRLLLGVLAACPFTATITGDASLQRRPMGRVVEPLALMGASFAGPRQGSYPPLTVRGGDLQSLEYTLPVASAQVKSALLLAALNTSGTTTVYEPVATRDHTERMMEGFGVKLQRRDRGVALNGPQSLEAAAVEVPGDISSAAFLLAAALLVPGSSLRLCRVGINPTRTGLLDVLGQAGAQVRLDNQRVCTGEPVADLLVEHSVLQPFTITGNDVPRLVDEIPLLALLATRARGTSHIRGAGELRVKESDRLAATAAGLQALGARVEEREDGLTIHGPADLTGAELESGGDHRMAMSWLVAGLIAAGETRVRDCQCIDVSFPGFSASLRSLGAEIFPVPGSEL